MLSNSPGVRSGAPGHAKNVLLLSLLLLPEVEGPSSQLKRYLCSYSYEAASLPHQVGAIHLGIKLNIQKTKIMVSSPITSWQIDGETTETVTDFLGLQNHCRW